MGYRSDVRIRTTKKGLEIMEKSIEKYIMGNVKEEKLKDYDYNLLNLAEKTETEESITLDWKSVKWYKGIEGYEDVDAIMYSLDILSMKNIDYQYVKIGEELDDIEEQYNMNNGSFNDFYVSRIFKG